MQNNDVFKSLKSAYILYRIDFIDAHQLARFTKKWLKKDPVRELMHEDEYAYSIYHTSMSVLETCIGKCVRDLISTYGAVPEPELQEEYDRRMRGEEEQISEHFIEWTNGFLNAFKDEQILSFLFKNGVVYRDVYRDVCKNKETIEWLSGYPYKKPEWILCDGVLARLYPKGIDDVADLIYYFYKNRGPAYDMCFNILVLLSRVNYNRKILKKYLVILAERTACYPKYFQFNKFAEFLHTFRFIWGDEEVGMHNTLEPAAFTVPDELDELFCYMCHGWHGKFQPDDNRAVLVLDHLEVTPKIALKKIRDYDPEQG
jgi:hypothetical protein